MHLMLTDETNVRPSEDATFFIYGGILFPLDVLSALDRGIAQIRSEAGFLPQDQLKFATPTRPDYVSQKAHTTAKKRIVDLCLANDIKFIVHIIHHGIIRHQDPDQQIQWAADYVIGRYNHYLTQIGDDGICIVDNLPVSKQFQYLADKFSLGLQLRSGRNRRLNHILLFGSTCINAAHANSAMDIILGTFRYCINNPRNIPAAREMISKIIHLMWHLRDGDTYHVIDRGLIIRPPLARLRNDYLAFKPDYDRLFQNINELLRDAEGNNGDS